MQMYRKVNHIVVICLNIFEIVHEKQANLSDKLQYWYFS